MSTEQTPPAGDSGALSIDAFVSELDKVADAPVVEEEEPDTVETTDNDVSGDEEVELEADDDLEEEEVEEEEKPQIPPPKSWSAEDQAVWAKTPPEVQEIIAKREADRDRAVQEATTKAGRAAAEVKTLAENYTQVAAQATDEVTRAAQDWQTRWGNVDWVRYAQENPEGYIAHKAQADAERQQIVDYANHLNKVKADADKAAKLARDAFLTEEWTKLEQLAPELVDPKEGKARRAEVIEYLGAQGFAQDTLADISAAEMTIARKAMLWDNAQKAATKQAAIPRKNPTSTAKPLPSGGTGDGVPSAARVASAANARLAKSGRIDDFVAALDAEEAQRNRKAKVR